MAKSREVLVRYTHGKSFERGFLEEILLFAEELFYRAKSLR